MPRSAARSIGSAGENITHFNAVRMRIVGSGTLNMSMSDLDAQKTSVLVPFTLQAQTGVEPTRLCNFFSQRGSLRIGTELINEYFIINRIILFTKQLATSYPG